MLILELKKEFCIGKNGNEYCKNHYIFKCSNCGLLIDIVDFNNVILANEIIEGVSIVNVVDVNNVSYLHCPEIEYRIPWNYKSAISRLLVHSNKCVG